MKKQALMILAVGFFWMGCQQEAPSAPPSTLPEWDVLTGGWHRLAPEGETRCSDGSPYAFFVRKADPKRLLVFFQGGGACWTGENCSLDRRPTYTPVVNENQNPETFGGIFDVSNPENPFTDYSMLFVPYCTGDVHAGNKVTTYTLSGTEGAEATNLDIHHKGYINAMSALNWTFDELTTLNRIFVAGSSAGALPAPLYTTQFAEKYPSAHIVQLGDGAGGYRHNQTGRLYEQWGTFEVLAQYPAFSEVADQPSFERVFIEAAREYPNLWFAQYNNAYDRVQVSFLRMLGVTDLPLLEALKANYADIEAEVDNFRHYTAGGDMHTILRKPEFYFVHVEGRRFRDWVAALEAGLPVANVMCTDCTVMAR